MNPAQFKPYFDKIDAELLKISPQGDIMLLRVITAVIPDPTLSFLATTPKI